MFQPGDRVRLGPTRGGVVVQMGRDGYPPATVAPLRVQWPDGSLGWLDHCAVDDGPDGRIDPNGWDSCLTCGNPSPRDFCVNCERRAQEDMRRAEAREQAREAAATTAPADLVRAYPPPAPGVHVAAAPTDVDPKTGTRVQFCARCRAALKVWSDTGAHPGLPGGGFYQPGMLIERGNGWQAISLAADAPTCEPSA